MPKPPLHGDSGRRTPVTQGAAVDTSDSPEEGAPRVALTPRQGDGPGLLPTLLLEFGGLQPHHPRSPLGPVQSPKTGLRHSEVTVTVAVCSVYRGGRCRDNFRCTRTERERWPGQQPREEGFPAPGQLDNRGTLPTWRGRGPGHGPGPSHPASSPWATAVDAAPGGHSVPPGNDDGQSHRCWGHDALPAPRNVAASGSPASAGRAHTRAVHHRFLVSRCPVQGSAGWGCRLRAPRRARPPLLSFPTSRAAGPLR